MIYLCSVSNQKHKVNKKRQLRVNQLPLKYYVFMSMTAQINADLPKYRLGEDLAKMTAKERIKTRKLIKERCGIGRKLLWQWENRKMNDPRIIGFEQTKIIQEIMGYSRPEDLFKKYVNMTVRKTA